MFRQCGNCFSIYVCKGYRLPINFYNFAIGSDFFLNIVLCFDRISCCFSFDDHVSYFCSISKLNNISLYSITQKKKNRVWQCGVLFHNWLTYTYYLLSYSYFCFCEKDNKSNFYALLSNRVLYRRLNCYFNNKMYYTCVHVGTDAMDTGSDVIFFGVWLIICLSLHLCTYWTGCNAYRKWRYLLRYLTNLTSITTPVTLYVMCKTNNWKRCICCK